MISRALIALSCAAAAAGSCVCFSISEQAGFACLLSCAVIIAAVFTALFIRRKKISSLSDYLSRIASGEYALDIRDNAEGEISVLKNEIYKVTSILREQSVRLSRDKEFLSATLADISHQIKTPLTSLIMMTELIMDPGLTPDKRDEFIASIRSQLTRLEWLVSSLLKLSKLDAGAISFKKETVELGGLISGAVRPLAISMELKGVDFEMDGPEGCTVIADPRWTAEAVLNIVKNCVEHTPPGGKITAVFMSNALYWQITITDTGEGIAKADLPHVFERFYKGRNASPDSAGIGLNLAHAIITGQGGKISAKSDGGARFIIRFYKYVI